MMFETGVLGFDIAKASLIPQRVAHLTASSLEQGKLTAKTETVAEEAARGISELESFLAAQPVAAVPVRALVYA